MKKPLAKLETKKVRAYPPLDLVEEKGAELPYKHRNCEECRHEYLTQLKSEIVCPDCHNAIYGTNY